MSRRLLVLPAALLVLGVIASLVFIQPARSADVITDKQLATIRNNCTDLRVTLTRIQKGDLLLRLNRDAIYQTIANKLMVPLNKRIASNQLDGTDLINLTAEFRSADDVYYRAYKAYASALTAAADIDCTRQPSQFYDAVAEARTQRQKFYESDQKMVKLMNEYRAAVTTFSQQHQSEHH